MESKNRDSDGPYAIPRAAWITIVVMGVGLTALIIYAWTVQDDGLGAIESAISLAALIGAFVAGIYAYAQYREWAAEHHRFADYELFIQVSHSEDVPAKALDAIRHEDALPSEPMFILKNDSAIVRAVVSVHDRFPLRDCVLNVVVPADWDVQPLRESSTHYSAGTVTPQPRVNPDAAQDHGVRYTCLTRDLGPKGHHAAQVSIRRLDASNTDPFRLMVELNSTPAAQSEADSFCFALLAPRDFPTEPARGQ